MMPRAILHRRTLLAAMFGAGAALPGSSAAWFGGHGRSSQRVALAALCSHLNCPETVGFACRQALMPAGTTEPTLARALIISLQQAIGEACSGRRLAQAIRRQSRDDFRTGRVVMVDGWMLSLTETRLYALATLISPKRVKGG